MKRAGLPQFLGRESLERVRAVVALEGGVITERYACERIPLIIEDQADPGKPSPWWRLGAAV